MSQQYDPITIEIIQNSLVAIADEMFACMAKTAMSSVIYEVLDFGVAITDAEGNLASSGAGVPSFVGMLDPSVKAVIKKFAPDNQINPGDVFITNDPFNGGVSHLNDVVLIMPVFYQEQIIAWVANKGHWVDIGGAVPGGISPNAIEIFQEGLFLPEVKLFIEGKENKAVFDIIEANCRLPKQILGDLWAGIASMRVGEKRLKHIADKYGKDAFLFSIKSYLEYGEKRALKGLRELPKGTFYAEDKLDDGRSVKVAVTVTDDEFIVDLRGNPEQDSGPFNASYDATLVSAQVIFKGLTTPQDAANAGSFKPIRLLCDKGGIFSAEKPAAVGMYYENKIRSADLVWKAMAPQVPHLVTAGHFCSICATMIGSKKRNGEWQSFIEPELGGWGAGCGKDGENAQFSGSHGDTYNCPVEVNEARNGIFVDRYTISDEPGGAGEYRGGKGVHLDYRILSESAWVTAGYTRTEYPPWGMGGGKDGSVNKLQIKRHTGELESPTHIGQVSLSKNDVVCITTGNGGGYGDPQKRSKQKILDDIKNAYISTDEAIQIYGLQSDELALIK